MRGGARGRRDQFDTQSRSDPAAGLEHFPLLCAEPRVASKLAGKPVVPVPGPRALSPLDGLRMSVDPAYEIGECPNTPHETFKAGAGATVHTVNTRQSPDRANICNDRQGSIAIGRVVRMVVHWVMVSWHVEHLNRTWSRGGRFVAMAAVAHRRTELWSAFSRRGAGPAS